MLRKCISILSILTLIAGVSMLSGCANIQDDGTRTRTEGAATGAAAGAILGAIIGQVAGGDTESTLMGAAIGGAIGGAGGYAVGNHIANQKARYASEEDWLNACIAEARKKNGEWIAYNKQLSTDIAQLKRDTAALKKEYANQQTRKAKLLEKKMGVDALNAQVAKELAAAREELKAQQSVAVQVREGASTDTMNAFDSEIAQLKTNIKDLEKQTNALASLSASMSV